MVLKRRRAKALTNYKKRVALLKSRLPRVVIRKSNRSITAQIVEYAPDGDMVKLAVNSAELKKLGWLPKRNIPTAYLTGMLLAKKAVEKGMSGSFILDTGLYKPIKNNVVFSAAKGCMDNGLDLGANIEADPARIAGRHIAAYAAKGSAGKGHSEFSSYSKASVDVKSIDKLFEEVKKKIIIAK